MMTTTTSATPPLLPSSSFSTSIPYVADSSIGTSSKTYLSSLLGSTLHLYTADGRMFAGEFKCTDKDRNIILARTLEYRLPGLKAVQRAAAEVAEVGAEASAEQTVRGRLEKVAEGKGAEEGQRDESRRLREIEATENVALGHAAPKKIAVEATSRFVGLVVVPGQYITRIDLEEK